MKPPLTTTMTTTHNMSRMNPQQDEQKVIF